MQDDQTSGAGAPARIALILAGGGARAAYQVGVLKAISQLLPKEARSPFAILCGTSAGAINAAVLAIYAAGLREGVKRMALVWKRFRAGHVFVADTWGITKRSLHWFLAMFAGGLGHYNPNSLLDCSPLRALLERYVPCERIEQAIDAGVLEALCVTVSGYTSGQSVSFFQGHGRLKGWKRARRVGAVAKITVDHLLASCAIPFIFPAVRLNREYFGDGSMGQMAPISPALHLGADRVLVIGVRKPNEAPRERTDSYPSLAQVAGHVLNSIFLESLESDLERLQRINRTIGLLPAEVLAREGLDLRPIEVLIIMPSKDLGEMAEHYAHHLPRPVRFLLRGVGVKGRSGVSLLSYLLFERPYCRRLIALGYADTMQRKDEVLKFLGVSPPP